VLEALDQLIDRLSARPEATAGEAGELVSLISLGELAPLVGRLLRGASPRESLLNLRKLYAAAAEPPPWPREGRPLAALAAVLSSGPELTRHLVRRPDRIRQVLEGKPELPGPEALGAELDRRLAGIPPGESVAAAESIVGFRNDHYLRLAAAEFTSAPLELVGRALADLADVCLDRAMRFALATIAAQSGRPLERESGELRDCTFGAVAMGKYGAQELNFCSDIDVIFLYRSDEGAAGKLTLHEFFAKVCQLVARMLSEPNAEGFAFRVDLRLRPEGSRGPICNSLGGAERYYETWGGPYDRLAWLKARSCAGDLSLGEEMIRILRPFVFPRSIRPEVIGEIQALNLRIKAQQPKSATSGWNVKLGAGGIREVEFFVQALQLLHAGKQEALQERATLRALDKLLFAGLISDEEHRQAAESYELWRRIEHRLQLHDGRQTHLLPAEGALRSHVAIHLGFSPPELDRVIAARRAQVAAIYATLSPETGSTFEGAAGEEEVLLAPLLDPELPAEWGIKLLGEAGFAQGERAYEQIQLLAAKPWGPFAQSRLFLRSESGGDPMLAGAAGGLALPLLAELARSPDPDAALLHLGELALGLGPYQGTWSLLAERRPLLRLLCSLFGSSDYLARLFIRHPELLDELLGRGRARPVQSGEELGDELAGRLGEVEEDDVESRLSGIARFRNEELLRIGLADIAGDLQLEEVWDQLSNLAEATLGAIYPLVLREASARYGTPRAEDGRPARLAVIALGKLGGRELTYASDLDLIFVYTDRGSTDGPGARAVDNGEFFARVVQRLIRALSSALEEGSLYQVDTRLRPSGKQGMLVSSFAAFREYHLTQAQTWERQVLLKARAVGGDPELGAELTRWIRGYLFADAPRAPEALRSEIARLRTRMERELADEGDDFFNLKLGRGGLVDVDFVVQYLQLRHGAGRERIQVRPTLDALDRLAEEGLLDRESVSILRGGYRFLRRIESRLRIVRDSSAERLPSNAAALEVMARRLGYRQQRERSAGAQLLDDYREQTAAIRAVHEKVLGGADA
jgi:glutamate-ammonia-ligase adenylyltransferase